MRSSRKVGSSVSAILSCLLLAGQAALAIDAVDVDVDDSSMTTIEGTNAQAALQSVDDEVTTLKGYHGAPPDWTLVYWRQNCPADLIPCFGPTDGTGIASFISMFIKSGPSKPVLIDVGPGTFTSVYAGFICASASGAGSPMNNVTIRGSGPGVTFIGDGTMLGMELANCFDLHVQDLTVRGGDTGVRWLYGGSSTWSNVEIDAKSVGWRDTNCTPGGGDYPFSERAVHYFYSTKINVNGASGSAPADGIIGFEASCSDNWFYGSEIAVLGDENTRTDLEKVTTVLVTEQPALPGAMHLFGSSVRIVTAGSPSLPSFDEGVGVSVEPGGVFHMHGGIISTNVGNIAGADVTGLRVTGGASPALGHTPDTAFAIFAGSGGTATRVDRSGANASALSPFLWQAGTAPPVAGLESEEGQDMYVETDCGADGDCDGGGSQAHIMVYNAAECPAQRWFDSTTGRCRNVLP